MWFLIFPLLQTTFGKTLKNVSWRIDLKAQAKKLDQINTPTAIVELQLANRSKPENVRNELLKHITYWELSCVEDMKMILMQKCILLGISEDI